jgi:hypothetical protein
MVLGFAAPARTRARLVMGAKPGWVRGLRGLGGDTPEGQNENVTVLQEGNGRRSGFARIGGTDSRRDQGFEAGEAGLCGGSAMRSPGRPGSSSFGCCGKGAHSRRGKRATVPKGVGVLETAGDKASLGSSRGLVDDCKGASGLERGQRDLREGNTLKEVA